MRICIACLVFAAWIVLGSPTSSPAADYPDADAAYRDGVTKLKAMQFDEARPALEAALKLAPDDAFRLKTYQALTQVYRRLPEPEPMIEAQEFLVAHVERGVERGLTARGLVAFLYQRGLVDKHVERWEALLKENDEDLLALSMLTAAYNNAKKNHERRDELQPKLTALEAKLAAKRAERLEQDAAAKPNMAAHYWKEAAVAWREANRKDKALAAADEAAKLPPPDGLLKHFYHRQLGEVYAECGKGNVAIEQLEKAVEATAIKGYQDDCKALIEKLRASQTP